MVINDPIHGFIEIPKGFLTELIEHPYFQRLSRIRQIGVGDKIYPGAKHTRFQHSIGAYHLTCIATEVLAKKGQFFFDTEREAVKAAMLLHDIGHGPFSHVLEGILIKNIKHETITKLMMKRMNIEFHGALNLAICIYKNEYHNKFLHQLICSQLDMDRLDYLTHDSFYTGVREGEIGTERLIQMLNIYNDELVIDHKGLFSVENYLLARRLMYWQVYLHKTAIAAEQQLKAAILRAKYLAQNNCKIFATSALNFFLTQDINEEYFVEHEECLDHFINLDDHDILIAIKEWQYSDDKILAYLSESFLNRKLFKVSIFNEPVTEKEIESHCKLVAKAFHISQKEARTYFVHSVIAEKEMYSETHDQISILYPNNTTKKISNVSHIINKQNIGLKDCKFYLIHPACSRKD